MKNLGYYNGEIGEADSLRIPLLDRANYFGDGCYDALYSRNGIMYCARPHLDRLYNSARMLDIEPPMEKEELYALLCRFLTMCDCGELFIYIQFSRGTGMREHSYGAAELKTNLTVTMTPCAVRDTFTPISCITVPDTRFYHCNIKTLNLLPNVMAAEKARLAGCSEAIFYRPAAGVASDVFLFGNTVAGEPDREKYDGKRPDGGGIVTECAHSNVHAIIDGVVRTHPADCMILPGIARANLLAMCKKLGILYSEKPFTKAELFSADEVMISSSGSFLIRVEEIDGVKVGGRAEKILLKLQNALSEDFLKMTEV